MTRPSRSAAGSRISVSPADHRYLQVARTLRKEIVDGVYPVGSQLPTEHELCERFAVSRYTVREALRRLRDDNLVASRPRTGTTVVPRQSANSYAQDNMTINDLLAFASGAELDIASTGMITLDAELATRTGLPEGEQWLAVQGFREAVDAEYTHCWTEYYVNRAFAGVGRLLQRHTGPIFPLIEDLYGISVVEVYQEIGAVLLTPDLAERLKVDAGAPAVEVHRTYKTSDGEIAQVTINTHPASRFRHSMTLRRVKG